ncbi:MAG: hypothetical protein NTV52_17940 [Acidobacteria bacterium]|nr:hypothetical protein [Acidobacteriota bacterium]
MLFIAFFVFALRAQRAPQSVPSLKTVPTPAPANLATYVRDRDALLVLGKALFWDMQLGSDGKVACASCHFHAGADHRLNNQLSNPGGAFPSNYRLTAADFPFHRLADPERQASQVLRDVTFRVGSSGMFNRKLESLIPGLAAEISSDTPDAVFKNNSLNLRQVTDRNSPSVINAVFNLRNFWDGRASETFSAKTPFGLSDTASNVLSNASGALRAEPLRLDKSSLASQAVGPVLSGTEMSYNSRNWSNVGKKLLPLRPLANQKIAPDDSVLARYSNPTLRGFPRGTTYLDLVKSAFQPAYWQATEMVNANGAPTAATAEPYTQSEFNFSLFFGLAVQAYEATLVSNDSPVDRLAEGQTTALNNAAIAGLQLFIARTGCNNCHAGAETTLASHTGFNGNDPLKVGRDTGFFYIGVRPIAEDLGLGGNDGFGKTLAAQLPTDASPASARGRFKTPGLRNVELTGPYFHNGGQATLQQVMEFYNRGGDFPPNASNGPDIKPLNLSPADQANLIEFMKALTDDRVKFERAPFDHPELCVADGHTLRANGDPASPLSAADRWVGLAPVGHNGHNVPLQTFEELLAGIGADGSRAHNMTDACAIEAVTATGFVPANAANFQRGILAQDSIVSAFGSAFTTATAAAETNPAPTSLAGLTVTVEDSAGVSRPAPLFFASPAQVNFLIPAGTAAGSATITVAAGSATLPARSEVVIRSVAPGLFGVSGFAAANVITFKDGAQVASNTVRLNAAGALEANPIDLGSEDTQVFLVLYGTGIRAHAGPVTARVGSATVTTDFAGPQGTFAGQDQINLRIPRTLLGAGIVDVVLNVDGQLTNVVKIQIK